ncbi:O-linked N-acetylglucosamine transferase, SPINDLY family protein [Synechocystis sp. LKSZ1]|uniref:O-linked N-acetylglucosamine transferase, SPINDLY family protein n=1 Tax=Synechocystis sp. LKSZ1 TaxID=3144951 RepID=UPI00336C0FE7
MKTNEITSLIEIQEYDTAIIKLEEEIEKNPTEITCYLYLGLLYLLQGKEDASLIWSFVMSQGDESEVKQWQKELSIILNTEASRQENLNKLAVAYLIRDCLRELEPFWIDNLISLIALKLENGTYSPEYLQELGLINSGFFNESDKIKNQKLLEKIIPTILDFPASVNLDFIGAIVNVIDDIDSFSLVLKNKIFELAYNQKHYNYASELNKIYLSLQEHDLTMIDQSFWINFTAKNFSETILSAETYLAKISDHSLTVYGYHKKILSLMANARWKDLLSFAVIYENLLNELVDLINKSDYKVEPIVCKYFYNLAVNFLYLDDSPRQYRNLQNKISYIYQYKIICQSISNNTNSSEINRIKNGKLRVGYIAHTFNRSSVGWLCRWLLAYHDKVKFEIYIYSISQHRDDILEKYFDTGINTFYNFKNSIQEIEKQIRDDKLNILVELDSVTQDLTLEIMSLKLAPIQITWLGFDASGLPAIDYFVADPYVLPEYAQEYYHEQILRLPSTYLAVDGFEVATPTIRRHELNIDDDSIVYLTMQSIQKYNPNIIKLQLKIISQVPNSFLLVKGRQNLANIKNLFCEIADEQNISLSQLRFLNDDVTEEIHRANLSIADVVLDTYPYNGATTTLEALWMEIPIVTKVGQQFAARNGYTFMMNAGIHEGIAWNDQEYIEWGVNLGMNKALRQQISWKLKESKKTSPLWDSKRFASSTETLYYQIWEDYLSKQASKID